MSDVTRILSQIEHGDPIAANQLLPLVYNELRRIAARQMATERTGHTLSPTALVHEAYLRLVGTQGDREQEPGASDRRASDSNLAPGYGPLAPGFSSRGHFFSAAAEAMRRILVESARRRRSLKRGGEAAVLPLDEAQVHAPGRRDDLLALDEALADLELKRPDLAELVKLRYFAGLTMAQAAETLGIPLRTAERNWTYAKVWLLQALTDDI